MDNPKQRPKSSYAKVIKNVPCPIHQTMLEVQQDEKQLYAICNCEVKRNPWRGQVVWLSPIKQEGE